MQSNGREDIKAVLYVAEGSTGDRLCQLPHVLWSVQPVTGGQGKVYCCHDISSRAEDR